jgi:SAM-dependent methyltransferase
LVYIGKKASPDFWDRHWNVKSFKKTVEAQKNNPFILKITKMFLQKGRVLEGGCGMGGNVYCLHYHGYSAYGVDFAEKTVKKSNRYFPELNITKGDVRNLKFEDGFFDGYWSLGVIEHFFEGYEDILREMKRVIKVGGFIFLTFPYMSPLRRFKTRYGFYKEFKEDTPGLKDFYQFVMDYKMIKNDFERYGFVLKYMKPKDGLKGFKDEVSVLKPVLQMLYDYKGRNRFILVLKYVLNNFLALFAGHGMLLVFEKPQ